MNEDFVQPAMGRPAEEQQHSKSFQTDWPLFSLPSYSAPSSISKCELKIKQLAEVFWLSVHGGNSWPLVGQWHFLQGVRPESSRAKHEAGCSVVVRVREHSSKSSPQESENKNINGRKHTCTCQTKRLVSLLSPSEVRLRGSLGLALAFPKGFLLRLLWWFSPDSFRACLCWF